jgi:predicted nucleic acid-binding Zn ribbon protein
MVARHPAVLEQSLVAIPAYEKADITPFGFKAAFDNFQEKRIENAQKAGWKLEEVKTPMPRSSAPDLTPLVISAFNTVTEVEIAVLETQARLLQGELEEALPGQTGRKAKPGLEHIVERMGGPEEWTPEDVIDEGKAEVMGGQDKCATCGHAEWYHQTDGCHAPTSYFPGAADCPCTVFAAKTEEAEVEDGDECSMCGGPLVELGSLGSVTHYRCRNCGMDFSKPSKGEAGGYACRDCGKTFGSLQSARNAAINGCPDCGCGNIDPSDSSEAGGYACRDCGKTFGSLQSARNAAINGCPDCGCGNIDPSDSKSEAGGAVADFPLAER